MVNHLEADVAAERPPENRKSLMSESAHDLKRDIGVSRNGIGRFGTMRIVRPTMAGQVDRDAAELGPDRSLQLVAEDLLAGRIAMDQ